MLLQPGKSRSSLPAAGLAACVLGGVLCPFIFVAIAIITAREIEPAFWFVMLPLLLISSGYLLYRFLRKPKEQASNDTRLIAEILSWVVIVAFVAIISKYPFKSPIEQVVTSLILFLLASLLSLPIVLMRKTALRQRLMRLSNGVATLMLVLVVFVSTAIVVTYFRIMPPGLPGGLKRPSAPSYLALGSPIDSDSSSISLHVIKYIDYVDVINASQDPITIKGVLFNNKPDCYVSKPSHSYPPIELQFAHGAAFFSRCDVIHVTVETDQGSATFKFDR